MMAASHSLIPRYPCLAPKTELLQKLLMTDDDDDDDEADLDMPPPPAPTEHKTSVAHAVSGKSLHQGALPNLLGSASC